jgi:hypothetical protein
LCKIAADHLCAIRNAIPLVAKGNKRDKTILNEDILTAAMGSIAEPETGELHPTRRLARCHIRNSPKKFLRLAKISPYCSWLPYTSPNVDKELVLEPAVLENPI